MKTKAFLLTLLNLVFLNSIAQNVTVNITSAGHDPEVCASSTFNVEIILSGTLNFSNFQFGIEDVSGLTFSNNPTSATIGPVSYKLYSQGNLNCTSSCTTSFSFNISYACSLIPQTNFTTGQVVSIAQHLIITDGLTPYSGNVSWTFNTNPLTQPQVTYDLDYYYLALQNFPAAVLSNKGRTEFRDIVYQNNGNSAFNGSLAFHDNFSCDKYTLTEIRLYDRIGATDVLITPAFTPGMSGTDHYFTYNDFFSAPIEAGHQLVIREVIHIDDCLDNCPANSNVSTFNISWGCAGNLCRHTTPFTSNVVRSLDRPKLTMYRMLPGPSGNLGNYGYWDQPNCTDGTIAWEYRIGNDGHDIAYDVVIPLDNPGNASSYLIDLPSVHLDQCPTCSLSIQENHSVILLSGPHIKCAENMATPISGINFHIDKLEAGKYVTLSFTTKYCCPGLSTGTDPNVYNLFNEPEKYFNTWRLYPVSKDECGVQTSFASDTPTTNTYVTGYNIGQNEQWHLRQTFDPTTTEMSGLICPNACDESNPVNFQITNSNFNAEGIQTGMYSKGIATMFCSSYNDNPALMAMGVRIKLVFTMGAALRLLPLTTSDIFIQNGATVWPPVTPLSSADSCNANGPTRTYEVIFDGAQLASALSLSGLDLKHFMNFFNGSVINFSLVACCCAADDNPTYSVKTYMEGLCPNCWIPFSEVGAVIHVHCPGCRTPGARTTSASLTRDVSSLGFPDSDNDGIKDTIIPIDTANYPAKYNLKYNRSIQGDKLVGIVNGEFFGGSAPACTTGTGMNYSTLQSKDCNSAAPPCTSTVTAPYVFSHLYLDQTIPFSGPIEFNLQLQSCTLTIKRSATEIYEYIFPSTRIDDINAAHTGSQFRFDVTPADVSPTFAFTPGETYRAVTTYITCSNYDPDSTSEASIYNKSRSEVFNAFYFSVMPLPPLAFPDYEQFDENFIEDPNNDCNGLCHNYIFQCSPVTCLHYFYTIHTKNYGSFFNNFPLSSSSVNACGKYLNAIGIGTIGGTDDTHYPVSSNIFPYEFRPSPVLNRFHITIPTGYKVKAGTQRLGNLFATWGACYPFAQEVSRKWITTQLTGDFYVYPNAIDAGNNMGLNIANECGYDNYESGPIIKGDENTYFSLFMELEVEDCPNTPALVDINSTDIQLEFAGHNCPPSSPVTDHMSCTNCDQLQKPAPVLTLNVISSVSLVTTTVFKDTIRITNPPINPNLIPNGHAAENVFLHFPHSDNDSVLNVSCISSCPSTPQLVSGFWRLGMIPVNSVVDYEITYQITNCVGTSGNLPISFYYGWNCYAYPTDINDPALCSKTLSYMYYQESPANVLSSMKINDVIANSTFQLCHDEKYEVKIATIEIGGVNNIRVSVSLPAHLDFSTILPELKYCDIAEDSCTTVAVATPSGSLFSFNLNLPPAANGYLSNGHKLILTFYVRGKCEYNGAPPQVTVRASRYCDNANPLAFDLTQPWTFSGVDNCSPLCCSSFSASVSGTNVLCAGSSHGSATVSVTNGNPSFLYIWNTVPPQITSTALNLAAGTYTCTVTDFIGCTASASVTITQPPAISINISSVNVTCNGGSNGTATANSSGGTGAHTYLWSNAQANSIATGLAPGIYTVTVTDANSCTATASVTITQPAVINVSMSSTPRCYQLNNGTATANVTGGTSPYFYLWNTSPVQTTSTANNLTAGTYTCTITDNHGCQQQGTATVSVNSQIILSSPTDPAAIIPPTSAGGNDGAINLSVSGGTSPYTYLWSTTATTQDILNLISGTYTVTVTDVYLCTATQSYFVPEPSNECDAGFATYTQGGYGNCGFPGQFMQNNFGNEFTSGLTIGCSGTGHYQLTAGCYQAVRNFLPSGTKNNGPQILNANYTNPIKPGCNFGGNCACTTNVACVPANPTVYSNVFAGQVMTLTLNVGFDGTTGFSTNTFPLSQLYYVGSGQFYGLTVGDILTEANAKLGGCSTTVSFTYTTSELNSVVDLINKSWDNAQCPNGSCGILSCTASQNSFSFSSSASDLQVACMPYNPTCVNGYSASILTSVHGGTPPYSYLWSNGETGADLIHLSPGIYAVTVTDGDANTAVRFAYVYSDASMNQPAYFSESITNLTAYFTDNSMESSSGATQTWLWNFGDPSSGTNTSTLQNPSHTFTGDGAYNVCLTVSYTSNLSLCSDTYCSSVCITPQVTASPSSVSFCDGGNASLTAAVSGSNSYSYQWKKDGNVITGATSSVYTATTAGSYTCVVSNSCGSSTSNALIVTVNYLPSASISASDATTFCSGNSVTLNANTGAGLTYQWKLNGNTISGATSSSYSTSSTGNYTCVVTNNCGSVTSNSISITVNSLLPVSVSISASATTICSGINVTFTATPANGGSSPSYQWKLNGSNVGTNSSYSNSSLANSDVVTCVLTSNITPCATGNPATSNSVTMTVNPLPGANTGSNQNVCSGETISLGAAPVSGNTYSWSPSTHLSSATVSNPTFTFSTAGTTNYTLTETITATGCQKSNGVSVTVISGGGNPTFTCNSTNLVVATPYTNCVSPGSNDYLMMKVKITLGGGCSGAQRKLQTLKFSASSATCSNIENAKLWYSESTNSFSNAQIVSGSGTITSVSCTADNTWNAGTLQVMQPGDNYFWVTYKIRSTATAGQSVQASLVNVTVVANGNTTCSTFGGSTSSRTIQSSGCGSVRIDNQETDLHSITIAVYPNPFTDQTTFHFVSEKDAKIMLELFDISGQKLKTIFHDQVKAGDINEVELFTSGMGAGIYYYRLSTEEEIGVGKLLIVK